MKKFILTGAFILTTLAFAQTDSLGEVENHNYSGYSKEITVNGMVCAFCSNSLEKKFKKERAVKNINIDLEKKKISLEFKKGKSIADKDLRRIITSSGFTVVDIKDAGTN